MDKQRHAKLSSIKRVITESEKQEQMQDFLIGGSILQRELDSLSLPDFKKKILIFLKILHE